MKDAQPNNPLHGITLETILNELVDACGWDGLGRQIDIRCFNHDPSLASSLKFLRRTPWARARVEALYVNRVLGKMEQQGDDRESNRASSDAPSD
jgi:uncharacterized protein (DUF2132 family)